MLGQLLIDMSPPQRSQARFSYFLYCAIKEKLGNARLFSEKSWFSSALSGATLLRRYATVDRSSVGKLL